MKSTFCMLPVLRSTYILTNLLHSATTSLGAARYWQRSLEPAQQAYPCVCPVRLSCQPARGKSFAPSIIWLSGSSQPQRRDLVPSQQVCQNGAKAARTLGVPSTHSDDIHSTYSKVRPASLDWGGQPQVEPMSGLALWSLPLACARVCACCVHLEEPTKQTQTTWGVCAGVVCFRTQGFRPKWHSGFWGG